MKHFNIFTITVISTFATLFFILSSAVSLLYSLTFGELGYFLFWINKKAAIFVVHCEKDMYDVRGIEYDKEYYKESIDEIEKIYDVDKK